MTRRRRVLMGAGALALTVGGACSPGGTTPGGEAKPGGTKDTGPIRVFQWDGPTSPFGVWLLSYFEAFPAKTGIQLEILQTQGNAPLPAQQAAWLAAGDVPDVFPRTARGNLLFAPLAMRGAIRPLTDFIKRDKFDQSDFWPNVLKLMTANDKQWIMPQDFNQTILAYNVTALQSAGAALPPADWKAPSWTWEELVKRSQQVQSRLPGLMGETMQWAMGRPPVNMLLWSNGAEYISQDGKQVTVAEPAAVEALDFAAKLIHTHRVAPTPQTSLPGGQILATQAVAMNVLAASQINLIRGQNKDLDFDVAPFPKGPARGGGYVASGGGGGYVFSGTSKHPDAAWELLKYIGAREYAEQKVKSGALGPRISVAREHFIQPGQPPRNAATYFDAPSHARWSPNLTNWDDVEREINAGLEPLLRGEQSPRDAAGNLKRIIEGLLPQGQIFQ